MLAESAEVGSRGELSRGQAAGITLSKTRSRNKEELFNDKQEWLLVSLGGEGEGVLGGLVGLRSGSKRCSGRDDEPAVAFENKCR